MFEPQDIEDGEHALSSRAVGEELIQADGLDQLLERIFPLFTSGQKQPIAITRARVARLRYRFPGEVLGGVLREKVAEEHPMRQDLRAPISGEAGEQLLRLVLLALINEDGREPDDRIRVRA